MDEVALKNSDAGKTTDKAADGGFKYKPALWACLKNYSGALLKSDLIAGLNVAFVALPLSIALAIAAGAPPQAGLYTSIMGGIAVAIFGGSAVQISGPTAAFVIILAPICAQRGIHGLMFAGMLAGAILVIMGLIRFGALIKYIPHPVTAGYNTGIAIVIATLQIKEMFGLNVGFDRIKQVPMPLEHDGVPGVFISKITEHVSGLPDSFWAKLNAIVEGFQRTPSGLIGHSALVGGSALAVKILYRRFFPRLVRHIPAPLVAIIGGVAINLVVAHFFNWDDVQTIGSRYGAFPRALPAFDLTFLTEFNWSMENFASYIMPSVSIAILCAVASLLSAVVADGMAGTKHDANSELIGQGMGNLASPLFGGIALSGAIARTIVNIRNGAKTPFASIFHALALLAIILIIGPLVEHIPMPALAAVLMIVAYNMADFKHFRHLLSAPFSDVIVLFTCLFLTVFIDMSAAITVGMILAALLFMKRMSELTSIDSQLAASDAEMQSHDLEIHDVPRRVMIYSVDGPFFFGATEKAFEAMEVLGDNTKIVVLRMNRVPAMDATGLFALEKVYENLNARGIALILSGCRPQPREVMKKAGFFKKVGFENIKPDIEWSLVRCYELLGADAHDRRTGATTILPKVK